jgi:hypothetical protein
MLILNVPAGNGSNYQYAQNTITGAWAKITGWDATVWLNAISGIYYGDSNSVKKAWVGNLDVGVPIKADVLPAFSYFGKKALNKYFTMVRPYIQSSGSPSALYGINLNFNILEPQGTLSLSPPSGMVWGALVWGTMTWGGSLVNIVNWATVGGVGNSASLRLVVQNNGADVRLTNTDFVYNVGGIL